MKNFGIQLLWGFLLAFCYFPSCRAILPHSCRYSPRTSYSPPNLQCTESNLTIPITFVLQDIPKDIKFLWLNCPTSRDYTYCNVIEQNIHPFPAFNKLIKVDFWGFTSQGGGRFPLNLLLKNVKHQIEEMDIRYSTIGYLDSEYFSGFGALHTLIMEYNDITEIAVDTFRSLLPSTPVLTTISLAGNQIASFDWGILEPLADTLTDLYLSKQRPGLRSLHRSMPNFSMKKLTTLALSNNSLKSIRKAILETMTVFPNNAYNTYDLRYNPFCVSVPNCSCDEMKEFFVWMDSVAKSSSESQVFNFDYHCGNEAKAVHRTIRYGSVLDDMGETSGTTETTP